MNADDRSDAALVAAHLDGDATAFPVLYVRHRDRAFRTCAGIVIDRAAAADVTQDVFVKLIDRLDRFDGRAAFTTWLHRVLVNACHDHLRTRRPVPVGDGSDVADIGSDIAIEDHAVATERRLDVRAALASLPEDQRTVVVLHDVSGYRYDEIAAILEIPDGTVKSRLSRARRRLTDVLRQDEEAGGTGNETTRDDRHTAEDEFR